MSETFLAKMRELKQIPIEKIIETYKLNEIGNNKVYNEVFNYRNFSYKIDIIYSRVYNKLELGLYCDELEDILNKIYRRDFFFFAENMTETNFINIENYIKSIIDEFIDNSINYIKNDAETKIEEIEKILKEHEVN